MTQSQPGILADVPKAARYMTFSLLPLVNAKDAILHLENSIDLNSDVIGLGRSLLLAARVNIKRLRDFPQMIGPGIEVPSTPAALWCWLRGDDRGELIHRSRAIENKLAGYFQVTHIVDAFQYEDSRDMTGYIDGTENPSDDEAIDAAILRGQGKGLDGSSFVAVQEWVHDLDLFESMSQNEQDDTFGRRKSDNEEFDEAPPSAHVKRTAQESFEPEAFIVRRSMPWSDTDSVGLVFVAFGKSFDAFEAILTRMVGLDDGVVDALFHFTQPISGSYFWCPPVKDGRLDLSVVSL
jgi:putative iron-dependent peroxidase